MPDQVVAGHRFGKIVVLREARRSWQGSVYRCRCDCGKELDICESGLFYRGRPRRTSCGFACPLRADDSRKAFLNRLYHYHKCSSKKHGGDVLPFQNFLALISEPCFYCGAAPSVSEAEANFANPMPHSTVDRIDSKKGYVTGNVVPCCWPCNRFKGDRTIGEFISRIQALGKHLPELINKIRFGATDWAGIYGGPPTVRPNGLPEFDYAAEVPEPDIPDEG